MALQNNKEFDTWRQQHGNVIFFFLATARWMTRTLSTQRRKETARYLPCPTHSAPNRNRVNIDRVNRQNQWLTNEFLSQWPLAAQGRSFQWERVQCKAARQVKMPPDFALFLAFLWWTLSLLPVAVLWYDDVCEAMKKSKLDDQRLGNFHFFGNEKNPPDGSWPPGAFHFSVVWTRP